MLSYYTDIDEPCEYVKYTPFLFNKWSSWARAYQPDKNVLRPLGEKSGPDWMRDKFDCLETFYQFYISLFKDWD